MQVVVPDLLQSARLVVLPRRRAVAPERPPHGERDPARRLVDVACELAVETVEVFDVLVRYDDHTSRVVEPPAPVDPGRRLRIVADHVRLSAPRLVVLAAHHCAERAVVAIGSVCVHPTSSTIVTRRSSTYPAASTATPSATRAAPASRLGVTRSPRTGAARPTAITTLVSRTAATDAAEACWRAKSTSAKAPKVAGAAMSVAGPSACPSAATPLRWTTMARYTATGRASTTTRYASGSACSTPRASASVYPAMQAAIATPYAVPRDAPGRSPRTSRTPSATSATPPTSTADVPAPSATTPTTSTSTGASPRATGYTTLSSARPYATASSTR